MRVSLLLLALAPLAAAASVDPSNPNAGDGPHTGQARGVDIEAGPSSTASPTADASSPSDVWFPPKATSSQQSSASPGAGSSQQSSASPSASASSGSAGGSNGEPSYFCRQGRKPYCTIQTHVDLARLGLGGKLSGNNGVMITGFLSYADPDVVKDQMGRVAALERSTGVQEKASVWAEMFFALHEQPTLNYADVDDMKRRLGWSIFFTE